MKNKAYALPEHKRDADGRVIINMRVSDDTDFLSPFSSGEVPVISGGVAEFLDFGARYIPPKERLALHVESDCIDEREKRLYASAISEYYKQRLAATNGQLLRYRTIAVALAVLGLLTLALVTVLSFRSVIWSEALDIVAWVFLWEAVDIKMFRMREASLERKRCEAFCDMKVIYKES